MLILVNFLPSCSAGNQSFGDLAWVEMQVEGTKLIFTPSSLTALVG